MSSSSASSPKDDEKQLHEKLWEIFTFYSLCGCPREPFHINRFQITQLCKDCSLFNKRFSKSSVNVLIAAMTNSKNPNLVGMKRDRCPFECFRSLLKLLAAESLPKLPHEEAYHIVLKEILAKAKKRELANRTLYCAKPDIRDFMISYEEALIGIFSYFSSEVQFETEEPKADESSTLDSPKHTASKKKTQHDAPYLSRLVEFDEFVRFLHESKIAQTLMLTMHDIGDIFLSVIQIVQTDAKNKAPISPRGLSIHEFCEGLARCALRGFKRKAVSELDKIKALWMVMNSNIHTLSDIAVYGNVSQMRTTEGYRSEYLRGLEALRKKFTADWRADGGRDYLEEMGGVAAPEPAILDEEEETMIDILTLLNLKDLKADEEENYNSPALEALCQHLAQQPSIAEFGLEDD